MADAKIINYGQPIGAGSTAIPDNTAVALDIESTDAKDYITIDTSDGAEDITIKGGGDSLISVYDKGVTMTGKGGTTGGSPNDLEDVVLYVENSTGNTAGAAVIEINSDANNSGVWFSESDTLKGYVGTIDGHLYLNTNTAAGDLIFRGNGAERMRIDSQTGVTTVAGSTNIKIADTNVTADTSCDDFIIEGTGATGMSVLTPNNVSGCFGFKSENNSAVDKNVMIIQGLYDSSNKALGKFRLMSGSTGEDFLEFETNGVQRLKLDATGKITIGGSVVTKGKASFVLTGSIDVTGTNTDVPGTGTKYLSELSIGDDILVTGETRTIATITNDTTATVTADWGSDLANDTSPECNPAAFTVIRDTGDLGMVLGDDGKVGIGTVAPAYRTTVKATATNEDVFGVVGTNDGVSVRLEQYSSMGAISVYGGGGVMQHNINARSGSDGQVVFNDLGYDCDFRVEGDTKDHMIFSDASADMIGIGESTPSKMLDVYNGASGGDILCFDIYTHDGAVETSDERLKENIVETPLGLDFINSLNPVAYKWKDTDEIKQAYTVKETREAPEHEEEQVYPAVTYSRTHHGLIAQQVGAAIEAAGLTSNDFAGFCYEEERDEYRLRYSQFIAPLIKAVQELSARIATLEAGD